MTGQLPFSFPSIGSDTGVRVNAPLGNGVWLRTCADDPVLLRPQDWPEGLAASVDTRIAARNGFEKGRVLFAWSRTKSGGVVPAACCSWHLHSGNWPICVLDAGWSAAVDDEVGQTLVEDVLFAALRQLAADEHLRDTSVPRPSNLLVWHVNHEDGAGNLQERKQRARATATRAMGVFAFEKRSKGARPQWAREGFYGERRF
ncbi:MAG TPA: hypothetical protein VGH56_10425 [Solirubrobacteraceae bacterium]